MLLCFYAFALSGRECDVFVSHTQGAASLALGCFIGLSARAQPLHPRTISVERKFLGCAYLRDGNQEWRRPAPKK